MASTFVRSFRGSSGQARLTRRRVGETRELRRTAITNDKVGLCCSGWDQRSRLQRLRTVKHISQFVFSLFQNALLLLWKVFPGAIDVEVQHRHRRLIRRAFAPFAMVGGAFERERDLAGIFRFENSSFEIECVAMLRDFGRPSTSLGASMSFR
jgi:hypothetical protein